MANSGFIQLRRGLSEHVRDGRLSFFEASLYVFILMDTNPATGLCYGSAGLFAAIYGVSSRTCRDALEKLEEKGYLKRFPTRGKHGSYPILVNKFICSIGAMKGLYVNIDKSTSYKSIYYVKCDDIGNDSVYDDVNDSVEESAASKILETREERQDIKPSSLAATKPQPKKVRLQDFPEAWNRSCGNLPKVETFSESRKKQVTTRIRQGITVERFEQAVRCCTQKPFLRGENGWNATFDWLIKNDRNIENAISNPYGSQNGVKNGTVPHGKAEGNLAVLAKSLGGTKHQSPSDEDGLFSASANGTGDARTVHGVFETVRPESLPSGDGDDLGERTP